jgi:hypothetical protein
MNKWININLPWSVSVSPETPEFPHDIINPRAKIKFGKTKFEARDSLADLTLEFNTLCYVAKDYDKEKNKLYKTKKFKPLLDLNNFLNDYEDWLDKQPEIISWNKGCDDAYLNARVKEKGLSFCGKGLNKPGTMVEVDGKKYLIGDINANRGVCDDCAAFTSDSIVKRYKVIK